MHHPVQHPQRGPHADGGLGARLHRFSELLGVAGASLALVGADGLQLLASTGGKAANLMQLDALTIRSGHSVITHDTQATGPTDARFYVGLLVRGGDADETYLLSLFDRRPRSVALYAGLDAGVSKVQTRGQ